MFENAKIYRIIYHTIKWRKFSLRYFVNLNKMKMVEFRTNIFLGIQTLI